MRVGGQAIPGIRSVTSQLRHPGTQLSFQYQVRGLSRQCATNERMPSKFRSGNLCFIKRILGQTSSLNGDAQLCKWLMSSQVSTYRCLKASKKSLRHNLDRTVTMRWLVGGHRVLVLAMAALLVPGTSNRIPGVCENWE